MFNFSSSNLNLIDPVQVLRGSVLNMGQEVLVAFEGVLIGLLENDYERMEAASERCEALIEAGRTFDEQVYLVLSEAHSTEEAKKVLRLINTVRLLEQLVDQVMSIHRRAKKVLSNNETSWVRTIEPLYMQANVILQVAVSGLRAKKNDRLAMDVGGKHQQLVDWYEHFIISVTKQINTVDVPLNETDSLIQLMVIGRCLEKTGQLGLSITKKLSEK